MQSYLKINPRDTVAVALKPLAAGTVCQVDGKEVCLKEDIAQGHKFALCDMPEGTKVIKYGNAIGIAKQNIREGQWVHTHNIKTGLGDLLDIYLS